MRTVKIHEPFDEGERERSMLRTVTIEPPYDAYERELIRQIEVIQRRAQAEAAPLFGWLARSRAMKVRDMFLVPNTVLGNENAPDSTKPSGA